MNSRKQRTACATSHTNAGRNHLTQGNSEHKRTTNMGEISKSFLADHSWYKGTEDDEMRQITKKEGNSEPRLDVSSMWLPL